jgi:Bifunctional DNA primase/polymerase, N-terminal
MADEAKVYSYVVERDFGFNAAVNLPTSDSPALREATDALINCWAEKYSNATNTGILTHTTPAIDIDVLDSTVADKLQAITERMIGVSVVRYGQSPKRAILYKTDLPFDKLATPIYTSHDGRAHKVEVLCRGQQIVVHGIHPTTNGPYTWLGGEPGLELKRNALPLLTAAQAAEFVVAAERCMTEHGWIPKRKTNGAASPTSNGQSVASERERAYAQATLDGCAEEVARAAAGDVSVDPTLGVKYPKRKKGPGFPAWTEADAAAYDERWPIGTKERVWRDVLFYTGLRRGDVVRVGRQHISEEAMEGGRVVSRRSQTPCA